MSASDDASRQNDDQEWKHITDREERRRAQNRIAQRRHRDRLRVEDEERQRVARNQQAAGSAYTPAKLQDDATPEGLPWGAFALSSKDSKAGTASSSRPSPDLNTTNRKASDDAISWPNKDDADRLGRPSSLLEVPGPTLRGLKLSISVPQLHGTVMERHENRRSRSVRARSRGSSLTHRESGGEEDR